MKHDRGRGHCCHTARWSAAGEASPRSRVMLGERGGAARRGLAVPQSGGQFLPALTPWSYSPCLGEGGGGRQREREACLARQTGQAFSHTPRTALLAWAHVRSAAPRKKRYRTKLPSALSRFRQGFPKNATAPKPRLDFTSFSQSPIPRTLPHQNRLGT